MIATREVTYDVDGLTMVAHLAQPDGEGPWPAVLIGHDGIGLDDYQRGRADDLAKHGYIALAMDYHAGRTFFGDPQAMLARVMPLMADPTRMHAIGRAALDVLLAGPAPTTTGSQRSDTVLVAESCWNLPARECHSRHSPRSIRACQPPAPKIGITSAEPTYYAQAPKTHSAPPINCSRSPARSRTPELIGA